MKPFVPVVLASLCLAGSALAQSSRDEQQRLERLRAFASQLQVARVQQSSEMLAQLDQELTHFVRESWSDKGTGTSDATPDADEEDLHPHHADRSPSASAVSDEVRLTAAQLVALSGRLDPGAEQQREQLLGKLIRASRGEVAEVARAEREPALSLRHDRCEPEGR